MNPHPIPQHTSEHSLELDSNEPALFQPRHIEGQCVHRWPSTHDPTQMVFHHSASRCQFYQKPGLLPTPPEFSDPNAQRSDALGFITPSPPPGTGIYNRSAMIHSLSREDSLDLHQTPQIFNQSLGRDNSNLNPYTSFENFNQQLGHSNPGDDSFTAVDSQSSNNQSLSRENIDLNLFTGYNCQIANSQRIGHENSQKSLSGLESQTSDLQLLSRESSLESPSPSNLSNQSNHDNANANDERAGSMTWEPLEDTPNAEPEPIWRDMMLKYVVYSREGVDPARGPTVAKNRAPKMHVHTFKALKFSLDLQNSSFSDLKDRLFEFSDQMGANSKGNSFIFKAAESTNSVSYIAYINSHEVYNKGAEIQLTCDEDVEKFYSAVLSHPKKISGIDTLMQDPLKKKLQAERNLSIEQHRLQAKNIHDNVATTNSDLAHSTPEDPVDIALASLMLKYSTKNNNNAEGWRVYKHNDVTKVMPMNFQLMGIWAEEMVKDPAVTVDCPPEIEGFEWTDLKHPVKMQTPLTSSNTTITQQDSPIKPGTISEAQGYDIVVDPYDLERVRNQATMDEYMAFAEVLVSKIDGYVKLLLDHDIDRFDVFLFPEETGLQDIIDMGIKRGTAMRLMICARRFYQHLINDEINNPKVPFDSSMVI